MGTRYRIVSPIRFILLSAVSGGALAGLIFALSLALLTSPFVVADGSGVVGLLAFPLIGAVSGLFVGLVPAVAAAVTCVLVFRRRQVGILQMVGLATPVALLAYAVLFRDARGGDLPPFLVALALAVLVSSFLTWLLARWTGIAVRLPPED